MEIFLGKGLGTDRKQKTELTRADIRTCCYFQHHCPTAAALHNKLLAGGAAAGLGRCCCGTAVGAQQLRGERARAG